MEEDVLQDEIGHEQQEEELHFLPIDTKKQKERLKKALLRSDIQCKIKAWIKNLNARNAEAKNE